MARERKIFLRISILLVLIAYVLYAGNEVRPGTQYIQKWTVEVEQADSSERAEPGWVPFIVKDYFGYISPDGSELFRDAVQGRVALLPQAFCNYDKLGDNLVIRDPVQNYMYPIDVLGYPIVRDDLFFILSADMTGVTVCSAGGEFLFDRRFTSLISSIDCSGGIVSIGLLKGRTEIFDREGNNIASLESSGSRIDAVYGTAVSSDGRMIAVIHGLDPQRVSIYRRQTGEYTQMKRFSLDEERRSQVIVAFSEDNTQLLVETAGGVELIDTAEPYGRSSIQLEGILIDYDFPGLDEPLYILSSDGTNGVIGIYRRDGTLYNQERFRGEATWLYRTGESLFLGVNNTLTRIGTGRDS